MGDLFIILLVAGLITGFSKFSIGGMGLLILPVIMIVFPGPEALGILIPIYVVTDLMAVVAYRAKIAWSVLFRILPLAFIGVFLGGLLLIGIDDEKFKLMLGAIIIGIILLGVWLDFYPASFMRHPGAAYAAGLATGFISFIANAAGPILSLFLVEQKLSKESYVSTRAWAFMMINVLKLLTLYPLGLVNWDTVKISALCLPGLLVGSVIGYFVLRRLNLMQFKWLIRIMAVIAAIKLFAF